MYFWASYIITKIIHYVRILIPSSCNWFQLDTIHFNKCTWPYKVGLMITASHQTLSSQNKHLSGQIKFTMYNQWNFFELAEYPDKFQKH